MLRYNSLGKIATLLNGSKVAELRFKMKGNSKMALTPAFYP